MGVEGIQARHGIFIARDNDMITKMIRIYGEWAEDSVQLIKSLTSPGDTILDIGANIGALTIPLAKHVGQDGQIYAIEGQIENFYHLCANLVINDLSEVRAFNCLAGDKRSESRVFYGDKSSSQSQNNGSFSFCNIIDTPFEFKSNCDRIIIETMDHILSHVDRLDLVKIDVEGAEPQVLNGMLCLINKHLPYIYCECASEKSYREIVPILESLDYSCFWHPTYHYRVENYTRSKNLTPGYGDLNLIAIHKTKNHSCLDVITGLSCVESWEQVFSLFPDLIF